MIRTIASIAIVAAALAAGSARCAEATFYQLPRSAYPHDVAPAADGGVWYSGQMRGFLGHFDPKTGANEEIPLGPNAAPHGVIVGPDGAPWLTEGGQNAIARVDPATRKVQLFPLPREFANANLNTAAFDRDGKLWFTGQAGVHGRVDPASGKVDAWKSPRPGSYGITATPAGEVWFASLAGDYIGHIDRATGSVEVVEPPRKGSGPRRIWSDSKGMLWVSFWTAGGIGRYDPAAKSWKRLSDAEEHGRHLRGLCRRPGPGVGDRLARQRDPALRSGERELRDLPERPARLERAPAQRPPRRDLGRRVGDRPAGGDQGLNRRVGKIACTAPRGQTRRGDFAHADGARMLRFAHPTRVYAAAALPFGSTSAE